MKIIEIKKVMSNEEENVLLVSTMKMTDYPVK